MAHVIKFSRAACGHMFKHYERAKDESGNYIKFSNQEIDTSKSNLNYNLAPVHRNGQGAFVKERCSEVKMQNRADVNVMCAWMVTAPKELQADETEKFFRETYKFLSERYGRDNVVSAYVHMDETTPHMHYAFVPVVMDKKKDIWKVSAKEAVDKRDLQTFHKDLSGYLEKVFGRDVGILNEATREGNKSIEELKQGTAVKELAEIKQETEEIKKLKESEEKRLQEEKKQMEKLKIEQAELKKEIADLENLFKGKQLKAEKLNKIKPEKTLSGNIKNITIDDIENLKKMAIATSRYKAALNKATQSLERLQKENQDLKSRIPKIEERIEQGRIKNRLLKSEKENQILKQRLSGIIDLFDEVAENLPEKLQNQIESIINSPRQHHQENDYEIGD